MAQTQDKQNKLQTTVEFSTVTVGDIFLMGTGYYVKMNNNNPNYTQIGGSEKGKLVDTDQVIYPNNILLTVD